jgi:hypothetical protein
MAQMASNKKKEYERWVKHCLEAKEKLNKINGAITSNSRQLSEWVALVKELSKYGILILLHLDC